MKHNTILPLFLLTLIWLSCFTGTFLQAQTGDPELDGILNYEKTTANNYLVFGYSYPTINNKLVLNNGAISLNFTSAGWYKDDGSHTITNPNYIAGFCVNSFRNFFSFDLSGITVPVTSAELQIQKYTSVPATGYAVWQLFDVASSYASINTDYTAALGNLSNGLVIYNDLGNGVPYGNDTIDGNLSTNTIISTALNSSAIIALNAAIGGTFIIGGKSDIHFPHLPPIATTASATNVQNYNALLNGAVNPRGTQTSVSFKYGTVSGNLLSEVPASPGTISGNSCVSVNASMTGLTGNTTYYFQIKAVNTDITTVYGQELSFTTNGEIVMPLAPVSPTPQNFCSTSTIANLIAQPPQGCIINWYDAPTGGNLLVNSFELTSGATYYAESYETVTGLSSLTRTAVTVSINYAPFPGISGSDIGCLNSGVSYYSTAPGMTDYTWTITEGGVIESGADSYQIQVSWEYPGEQMISLSYTSPEGCQSIEPAMFTIQVETLPDSAQVITGNPGVCVGSTGIQYVIPPILYAENYTWQLPEGAYIVSGAGSNSIVVTFSVSAVSGAITVYGENFCGAGRGSQPFDVTVTPLPDDPGTISGNATVCQGESAATYSVPPITSATAYVWTIPAGAIILSGANTNIIRVLYSVTASSGNVNVYGSNICGEGNISGNYPVTVNEIPSTPEITILGDLLQSSASEGNQWYLNGSAIPGATRQEYHVTQDGRYWSVVTIGGCHSDTSNNIDVLLTGTKEMEESVFQVYPVPNDGQFTVRFSDPDKSNLKIQVYNNLGIVVFEKNKIQWDVNSAYLVDLGSVPAGTYAVILQNDKFHFMKNMFIKKE